MNLTPSKKQRLFEVCKIIWPDVYISESGEILLPFSVELAGPAAPSDKTRVARRARGPSSDELAALVSDAQSVITFNGGTASRPPPKRQTIDELSYSYGLLCGVACALSCSLRDVLDRFGPPTKKRSSPSRGSQTNEQP